MKLIFIQENGIQESLGIANLSAFIKMHGHECNLYLESHENGLIETLKREEPGLIGFSCLTGLHKQVIRLAEYVKENMNIPIIIGGPHPTYFPEMIDLDCVDMICRGEGEYALLELMDKMSRGLDTTSIKNLWIKNNGKTYKNELRPLISDLDELPLPDRELYYKYDFLRDMSIKRFMSGYGCPFSCTFCHQPLLRKEYRAQGSSYIRKKSVNRVIEEIRVIKEKYPLKLVHFSDDLFYLDYKWLEEFSPVFRKEIALPFTCSLRFDSINERSIEKLKEAGCRGVQIGLETGSEELRNVVINKKCTNEQIIKGARLLHQYGIKLLTTNMIDLPGETLEDAFKTVELNARIKADFARANSFMAFPKVEIVEYAKEHGFLDKNYSIQDYIPNPQQITLPTIYENEFKNICALFFLMIKTPWLMPLYRRLVKLPDNIIFRLIGALNIFQEPIFFKVEFKAGWNYFRNTMLTKKGRTSLQWIPNILNNKG